MIFPASPWISCILYSNDVKSYVKLMEKNLSASQERDPFPAFHCRMCGECCQGQGGIVVGPRDLPRLCAHLHMEAESFIAAYGYRQNGKLKIRTSPDNACVFFRPGTGCSIHAAKPDVCRAWPFFRGNMVDEESLTMAKTSCPGINSVIGHDEFGRAGLRYLEKHQLRASDPEHEANALIGVLP
jgi:Fe-S-cluster containining protein